MEHVSQIFSANDSRAKVDGDADKISDTNVIWIFFSLQICQVQILILWGNKCILSTAHYCPQSALHTENFNMWQVHFKHTGKLHFYDLCCSFVKVIFYNLFVIPSVLLF